VKFDNSKKIKIIIGLAVLIAVISNAIKCVEELVKITKKDEVTQYDQRFGKLSQSLQSYGKVGYIQDGDFDTKAFFLTQYALAPVFLVQGKEAKLIVADLDDTDNYQQFCKNNKLSLFKNVGDNVFLLIKN